MTLCDYFERFFDLLFNNAGFSDTDIQQMKMSLMLVWFKRVGDQITPLMTQAEQQQFEALISGTVTPTSETKEKISQQVKAILADVNRGQRVIDIFYAEANTLLTHMSQIFSESASADQKAKLQSGISELNRSLKSSASPST
jgi:hypothetical protein